MKKEIYVNMLYNHLLKNVLEPFTKNHTTYLNDLLSMGRKLLGNKFKGVYPSDKIPKLNDSSPYAILNLDTSKEQGSHWIAIAKHGKDTYIYDSFGRMDTKIIPNLKLSGNGKIINTDNDVEQKIYEINCGARSLAWLLFFDSWGPQYALLI